MAMRTLLPLLLSFVLSVFSFNTPAHAQYFYQQDVMVKESLVQVLYQYGKEVFYRDLDPQEASFVFQRILVLDCNHQGARSFLDKIHAKYPNLTIRIWGCADSNGGLHDSSEISSERIVATLPKARTSAKSARTIRNKHAAAKGSNINKSAEIAPKKSPEPETPFTLTNNFAQTTSLTNDTPIDDAVKSDTDLLTRPCWEFQMEIIRLQKVVHDKDSLIADYKSQLALHAGGDDVAYSAIAEDQKDLIRVQQSNIDYLKGEIADLRKEQTASGGTNDGKAYDDMHKEIADSHLTTQEKEIDLNYKDQEVGTLRQQLDDLQEQLRLVQEIVNQKNATIHALQEELKAAKPVGNE